MYDRLKHYLLPELPPTKDELIQYEIAPTEQDISYEVAELIVHNNGTPVTYDAVVFMGKVSRSCKNCGEIKLYAEFDYSKDPSVPCHLCAAELIEEDFIESLEADDRADIEDLEEEIFNNESAYEEAMERQSLIDECLRGLDE